MTRLYFVFASMLVHLGIFTALKGMKYEPKYSASQNRFEVDLVPAAETAGGHHRADSTPSRLSPERREEKAELPLISIEKLVPPSILSPDRSAFESSGQGQPSQNPSSAGHRRDAFLMTQKMGLKEAVEVLPTLAILWERVNSRLGYPEDFAMHRIQGSVNLSLQVDRRGVWTGEIHSSSAANIYLETYVLAILSQSLNSPLPERVWFKEKEGLALALTFEFITKTDFQPLDPNQRPPTFFKNVLFFRRVRQVETKLNQQIRHAMNYMPPVVPIPGGFFIDFIGAYRMVKNWNQPSEKTLRRQRIRNLKRELEQMIRPEPEFGSAD